MCRMNIGNFDYWENSSNTVILIIITVQTYCDRQTLKVAPVIPTGDAYSHF